MVTDWTCREWRGGGRGGRGEKQEGREFKKWGKLNEKYTLKNDKTLFTEKQNFPRETWSLKRTAFMLILFSMLDL